LHLLEISEDIQEIDKEIRIMEAIAKLNNCPTSPRKMRGQKVDKALFVLRYSAKEASDKVEKLLLSAINNWQQKNPSERIEDNELYVKSVMVDGGRILKRMRPAPQGRGHKIRKRSNHVTIVVDSLTPVKA
jgi:large subunit ribosomal protein L22